ncbi:hypothetical protein LZ30DRAFT_448459 [Colletotrichum cereale]|nr:hypothetical protein LZ30DRAFT_448459 [Colletotrichum cereale]
MMRCHAFNRFPSAEDPRQSMPVSVGPREKQAMVAEPALITIKMCTAFAPTHEHLPKQNMRLGPTRTPAHPSARDRTCTTTIHQPCQAVSGSPCSLQSFHGDSPLYPSGGPSAVHIPWTSPPMIVCLHRGLVHSHITLCKSNEWRHPTRTTQRITVVVHRRGTRARSKSLHEASTGRDGE